MSYQEIVDLQGYTKIILMFIAVVVFYFCAYSIYKRDKKGERKYEEYSNLVHDDSIDSKPLEERNNNSDKKEKNI
ncbi:Cytochrome c oxidase cbb3-type CcoQ [Arcobacter nitrofigilis DSM 7299]|uniref:Cytochrome c oxidase cbb3-type CcoQ n=1 Tax=Arcobacter nitrofigilis (strain ATCC 33309 / DSM 7299 / CCUG 15893 / LMG 7604 / NCTC 12251 / CI) TaxID=572480 RepID=D5V7S5_ARCNC|nr:CcoQ/FixQ family Cbb3-type cytochrome c oxidase assembly chaperone [Arcobacter nitrofigilis]ADG94695.1 Cytochrome c oxidase cbb3-type CcoQ [Arcobacter nitrofigilis DSM 7299]